MNKRIILLSAIFASLFAVTGCDDESENKNNNQTEQNDNNQVEENLMTSEEINTFVNTFTTKYGTEIASYDTSSLFDGYHIGKSQLLMSTTLSDKYASQTATFKHNAEYDNTTDYYHETVYIGNDMTESESLIKETVALKNEQGIITYDNVNGTKTSTYAEDFTKMSDFTFVSLMSEPLRLLYKTFTHLYEFPTMTESNKLKINKHEDYCTARFDVQENMGQSISSESYDVTFNSNYLPTKIVFLANAIVNNDGVNQKESVTCVFQLSKETNIKKVTINPSDYM